MSKRPCEVRDRPGVTVYRPVYIHDSAVIGENTRIGKFCDIGKDVRIGTGCNIQCLVSISNGCKLGNNVFIGPGARLLNDKYMNGTITPVTVQDDVKIGGGAVILPGVILGEGCLVGAGAVVTARVPAHIIVHGNPARMSGLIEPR